MNRRGRDTKRAHSDRHDGQSAAADPASAERGSRRVRRRRRPSRILGMWARVALLTGAVALLVTVAVAIVAKVFEPYLKANGQSEQLASLNRQIAQTDADNAAYQRRLTYLNTREGVIAEARRLGYHEPGEVAVVVTGTPGVLDETPATPPTPPAPTLMARMRHFWHSLVGSR
jgi:hypothetical protein